MKSTLRIIITSYLLLITYYLSTAQIAINTDGIDPDASAMLDVSSTDKGILIPRMTTMQRTNISSPATGLLVYDTTTGSFWYFGNGGWNEIENNAASATLSDADGDTKIQVEESSDEDMIRFDVGGTEFMRLHSGRLELLNTGSSLFIGEGAGASDNFDDNENLAIGKNALTSVVSNNNNIAIGNSALTAMVVGDNNIALGRNALSSLNSAGGNVALGVSAMENTAGANSNFNVAIGQLSGQSLSGKKNILIGYQAGKNTTGDGNVFIGHNIANNINLTDKLLIDNFNADTTNALIYGDFSEDRLHINGDLTVTGTLFGRAFTSENGITSSTNNDDDFIVGVDSINLGSGTEYKLFFDKSKGAIRAGAITNDKWDEDNLGNYSVAFGNSNLASGNYAMAFGGFNSAYGTFSTTWGDGNNANGTHATAWGQFNDANGTYSTVSGLFNIAQSYGETVIGLYNTTYTANNATGFDSDDRLFVIGNGQSTSNRSDALIVYKSGATVLNGNLTINGGINTSSNDDDFLVGAESLDYVSGTETKLFFDQGKGAFRVGTVNSTYWDDANVGDHSIAFGENTTASGTHAMAWGYNGTASATHATAWGYQTIASYNNATAWGYQTTASGIHSTAYGIDTRAYSYAETVLGSYSTDYSPNSFHAYDSDDRLFVIGNGTADNSRSDAMLIYKNGNTEINGQLTVGGNLKLNGNYISNDGNSEGISITNNGHVTMTSSAAGGSSYILTVTNTSTNTSKRANGLNVIAGHDSYNNINNRFIHFSTPNGTTVGEVTQNSTGVSYNNTSDVRLKTNIQPTQYGLTDILNIQVKDYHYKSDTNQSLQTGFLAQQLHEVFPVAVKKGGDNAKTNPWMVDYSKITPLLVKGIQELSDENEALKLENKNQNERLEQLEQQNAEMKAMLEQIQQQLEKHKMD